MRHPAAPGRAENRADATDAVVLLTAGPGWRAHCAAPKGSVNSLDSPPIGPHVTREWTPTNARDRRGNTEPVVMHMASRGGRPLLTPRVFDLRGLQLDDHGLFVTVCRHRLPAPDRDMDHRSGRQARNQHLAAPDFSLRDDQMGYVFPSDGGVTRGRVVQPG